MKPGCRDDLLAKIGELSARVDAVRDVSNERHEHAKELRHADQQSRDADRESDQRAVSAAFDAAKEARAEAQRTQDNYNVHTNQLRETFFPREEAIQRFAYIERELLSLRDSRSESTGRREQVEWIVPAAIAFGALVVALGIYLRGG